MTKRSTHEWYLPFVYNSKEGLAVKTYDILLRVSSMGTRRESADSTMTLTDQEDRCRRRIAAEDGRVGKVLHAKDVSGWVAVDSPAFREALGRANKGASDGFSVAYGDRLGRNVRGLGRFYDECDQANAAVLFADRPELDYRSEEGRMMTTIDGLTAERKYLTDKARGEQIATRVILERGITNQVPYGYRRNGTYVNAKLASVADPSLDEKALVRDPETAPVVTRIFTARSQSHSWVSIADALDRDDIPPPRGGGHWTVATLRGIIGNESYLGVVKYRRRSGGRRGSPNGTELRREGAHEPLVSRSLWLGARSAATLQRSGRYEAGVAGGLVRCSTCGSKMVVSGTAPYLVYGCRRQMNHGRCTQPMHVTKRVVDEHLDALVVTALQARSVGNAPGASLAPLHAAVRAAKDELGAYVEAAAALDGSMFERGLRVRQEKLDAAQSALDAEEGRTEQACHLPAPDSYLRLSVEHRRDVARSLFDRIVVSPVNGGRPVDRLVPVER